MNHKEDLITSLLAMFVGMLLLSVFLITTGKTPKAERERWEKETIKRGYAEYVVDVDTKEVKFQWKDKQ